MWEVGCAYRWVSFFWFLWRGRVEVYVSARLYYARRIADALVGAACGIADVDSQGVFSPAVGWAELRCLLAR